MGRLAKRKQRGFDLVRVQGHLGVRKNARKLFNAVRGTTLGQFMREVLCVLDGHRNLDYHGIRSHRDHPLVARRVSSPIIFNPFIMPIQPSD